MIATPWVAVLLAYLNFPCSSAVNKLIFCPVVRGVSAEGGTPLLTWPERPARHHIMNLPFGK